MGDKMITVMSGVRGGDPGSDVELWRNEDGRLVARISVDAGLSCTEIDMLDVLSWTARNLHLIPGAKEAATPGIKLDGLAI